MKFFKWALAGVLGLILIALAGVAALVFMVDPNNFKPEIIKVVKEQTGRKLTIDGNLAWTFFPSIGVDIGKTELANAQGFADPYFAKVDQASVSVKLMPLFAGKVEIDTIYLDGVAANLETDAKGRNNWDDLVKANQPKTDEPKNPSKPSQSPQELLGKLRLNGIDIKNVALQYRDKKTANNIDLKNVYLKTGAIVLGKNIDIKGGLALTSSSQNLKAQLDFSSQFLFDIDKNTANFDSLGVDLTMNAAALGTHQLKLKLATTAFLDLQAQQLALDHLNLKMDQSTLKGALKLAWAAPMKIDSDLNLDQIDVDYYLKALAAPAAKTSGKTSHNANAANDKIELPIAMLKSLIANAKLHIGKVKVSDIDVSDIQLAASAKGGLLAVDSLKLNAFGALLSSSASLNVQNALPAYKLNAEIGSLELLPLLKNFAKTDIFAGNVSASVDIKTHGDSVASLSKNLNGKLNQLKLEGKLQSPELAQPVALKVDANAELIGKSETIKLNSLKAGIDETNIDGSASVVGFGKPVIQFKVDIDAINLDQYMSASSAQSQSHDSQTGEKKPVDGDAELLPIKLLQSLNLAGSLKIGKLQVMQSHAQNMRADLSAKDGLIVLKPLAMQLYSGEFAGSAVIDATGSAPSFKLQTKLAQVKIDPLLHDLADLDFLAGQAGANLNISAHGNSKNKLLGSLNGKWDMSLAKGELKSNLLAGLAPFLQLSKNPKLAAAANHATTPFETLFSSGSVKNGIITTNQFELSSKQAKFGGGGSLDLGKSYLDFGLDIAHDGYSCTIPVKGKIATLNYKKIAANAVPNCLKDAAQARAKEELDAKKQELQQKLDAEQAKLKAKADAEQARLQEKIDAEKKRAEDKAKEKIKDKLKGLFN